MKTVRNALFFVCGLSCVAAIACGDEADEITNTITCADVCQRYSDCFDEDYDVDACTDSCENSTTPNEEKEAELEECDACIEGESCTGALVGCTAECAQFVP